MRGSTCLIRLLVFCVKKLPSKKFCYVETYVAASIRGVLSAARGLSSLSSGPTRCERAVQCCECGSVSIPKAKHPSAPLHPFLAYVSQLPPLPQSHRTSPGASGSPEQLSCEHGGAGGAGPCTLGRQASTRHISVAAFIIAAPRPPLLPPLLYDHSVTAYISSPPPTPPPNTFCN